MSLWFHLATKKSLLPKALNKTCLILQASTDAAAFAEEVPKAKPQNILKKRWPCRHWTTAHQKHNALSLPLPDTARAETPSIMQKVDDISIVSIYTRYFSSVPSYLWSLSKLVNPRYKYAAYQKLGHTYRHPSTPCIRKFDDDTRHVSRYSRKSREIKRYWSTTPVSGCLAWQKEGLTCGNINAFVVSFIFR